MVAHEDEVAEVAQWTEGKGSMSALQGGTGVQSPAIGGCWKASRRFPGVP